MSEKTIIYNNLANINSLEELNILLNSKDLNNSMEISYASRLFTFSLKKSEYRVTMKTIVTRFHELAAEKESRKEAIGSIHDRIVQLDFEGDFKLSQAGFGSLFLRDLRNFLDLFFTPHDRIITDSLIKVAKNVRKETRSILALEKDTPEQRLKKVIGIIKHGDESTKNAFRLIAETQSEGYKTITLFWETACQAKENGLLKPSELQKWEEFFKLLKYKMRVQSEFRDRLIKSYAQIKEIQELFLLGGLEKVLKKIKDPDTDYRLALKLLAECYPNDDIIKFLNEQAQNKSVPTELPINNQTSTFLKINGTFEKCLPRNQIAPCWETIQNECALDLQNTLNKCEGTDFNPVETKLKSYQQQNRFFCLTDSQFYEVKPGACKPVQFKVQVKEGTITWYITGAKHDETTQEFRNKLFRTAALGHLLVSGACGKYYRGTNSMHIKRMHTNVAESQLNHNHYRVNSNHVTVDQFKQHLEGFLEAQEAYGLSDKFLTQHEVNALVNEYRNFDVQRSIKDDGVKTRREIFHEQEQLKWTELDKEELTENKTIEEPCEGQKINVPLNQKKITVTTTGSTVTILPKEWIHHKDKLDKKALDVIAKTGSEGQKSEIAHTRQIQNSYPTNTKAYKSGELFDVNENSQYPKI